MYLGRIVEAGPTEEVLPRPAAPLHAGAAVRRTEIDQHRAGRARAARCRTRRGSRRAAASTRAARRCADGAAEAAGVDDACRRTALRRCCPPEEGHHVACHLVAAATRSRPAVTGLQAALPREMYVDDARVGARARRVLFGDVVLRRSARRPRPRRSPAGSRWSTWWVSRSWSRATTTALHAAYNVCRHRGSQLVPGASPGAEPVCAAAGALRCPYHSWTYALDGRLLQGAAHRRTATSTRPTSRCTRSGSRTWAGFVFVHLTPGDAEPFADGVARARRPTSATTTWARW